MIKPVIPWEKKKGRKPKRPSNYEIKLHYYDLNMTARECASKWNVQESTVYRWVKEARDEMGGVKSKKEPA